MSSAKERHDELQNLTRMLRAGEDEKFFNQLFPKPEEHESATNRPAIEEILLSRKLRELLVEFAQRGDVQLANKASGIVYENFEILRRLAESEKKRLGFLTQGVPAKRVLVLRNQAKMLKRLFDEMKQARLGAVKTLPPPAVEPKVKAA